MGDERVPLSRALLVTACLATAAYTADDWTDE
jgi:hypothetical protein